MQTDKMNLLVKETLIQLTLSPMVNTKKPIGQVYGQINNSLKAQTISVNDFIQAINKGQSFCPALFTENVRKQEHFLSSQCIALDFDKNECQDQKILLLKEKGFHVNIVYDTFSSTEKEKRFRFILFFDQVVRDRFVLKGILNVVVALAQCDPAGSDPAKMYLGGKNAVLLSTKTSAFQEFLPFVDSMQPHRTKSQLATSKEKHASLIESVASTRKRKEFNVAIACENSTVFNHFVNGSEPLKYIPLRNLVLNMNFVTNGHTWMRGCMEGRGYTEHDFALFEAIKSKRYKPESMVTFDEAIKNTFKNVLDLDRCVMKPKQKLNNNQLGNLTLELRDLIDQPLNSARVIITMPGLGKTTELCRWLAIHPEEHFLMGCPTYQLVNETITKLGSAPCKVFPQFTLPYFEKDHHDLGKRFGPEKSFALTYNESKAKKGLCTKSNSNFEYMVDYKKQTKQFHQFRDKTIYLMTHKQLSKISTKEKSLKHTSQIFIDEDFIETLLPIIDLSQKQFEDLETEYNACAYNTKAYDRWDQNGTFLRDFQTSLSFCKRLISNNISEGVPIILEDAKDFLRRLKGFENGYLLAELLDCKYILRSRGSFHGIQRITPCKGFMSKMTLTSATVDKFFYDILFPGITIQEIPLIESKKPIIQHSRYMYSQSQMKKNNHLLPDVGHSKVITYKQFKGSFPKSSETSMHFGYVEGMNGLEAQDLTVIGTPVPPPHVTYLMAKILGFSFILSGTVKKIRWVTLDGQTFQMKTFVDEGLAQIEIRLARMKLEQAVGRARAIRNDCQVTVYSKIPCRQTDIFIDDKKPTHQGF